MEGARPQRRKALLELARGAALKVSIFWATGAGDHRTVSQRRRRASAPDRREDSALSRSASRHRESAAGASEPPRTSMPSDRRSTGPAKVPTARGYHRPGACICSLRRSASRATTEHSGAEM